MGVLVLSLARDGGGAGRCDAGVVLLLGLQLLLRADRAGCSIRANTSDCDKHKTY
jgi:hypothetical protein